MFYVYVLRSLKDGNCYWGHTSNVGKRLDEHNFGKVQSTKNRRPFELIGTKEFETRNEARWYEYNLKKHGDRKKKLLKEIKEASGS